MVSPLGPTLANPFLCHYEKKFDLMNVLLSLNLWFTNVTLTIFFSCLNLKNISNFLSIT